jgi:small subunit ribosomal protein S6
MKPYELTYIISSKMTSADSDNLKKDIETFAQNQGGLILKSEKTAPQSLAYPIKKHSSGYFATLEFKIEEKEIKKIKEKIEKDKKILRHFILIKKPAKQKRPEIKFRL